ncbi:hypothetical protein FAZ15_01455 [Sphingobacterium olei]|uniref:Uncharacterized protein n=1 Tax=Sphingobacterium olei TaxID=2571155 RepID=A0A4U0P6B3_9SPHI|nr:hypothetical protein [Sphingobacterium olei]TJZ62991.1 hypothetical protein FAZ15_01455 [Sphingobacterium olei]
MKYIAIILPLFLIVSCKERTRDFGGVFSLKIPSSWQYIPHKGIDSYVGLIAIDSTDTLFFDYGAYSNNLIHTQLNEIIERDSIIRIEDFDSLLNKNFSFTEGNLKDSIYLKSFLTEYYRDTVVQFFPGHIVTPRNMSKGRTGIFVDSIWHKEPHGGIHYLTQRFCLVGHNLSEKKHKAVLKAIKTLEFREPKSR